MTPNKRIFLNIVATYGRSLYAMACGLFTSRWVLMALGTVDYGLNGVIVGLTVAISFFNSILAVAVSRFYAVSVGAANAAGHDAASIEDCQRWFSVAVMLHTIVPFVMFIALYPVGIWAIHNYLVIPPDRIKACIWLFRFVCISSFIGMVNVPYSAMYSAKQLIAELTIYSVATTTANIVFVYFIATHPGDWLATYGAFTCAVGILPQVIIQIQAMRKFPECKFRLRFCRDFSRIRQLFSYAGWMAFGSFGDMVRGQGVIVLVNKMFGPAINASMTVATTVNGQVNRFAYSLIGAFQPAIANAYGAGDLPTVRAMALRMSKFALVLTAIFMIPLILEIRYVIDLWLKTKPPLVEGLCVFALIMWFIDESATGQRVAVDTSGKIAAYEVVMGFLMMVTLPVAWWFAVVWDHIYAVFAAMAVLIVCITLGRVYFARSVVGLPIRPWVFRVVLPIALISLATAAVGALPQLFCGASFLRVVATTALCECVFLPLVWLFVFDANEREFVIAKLCIRFPRLRSYVSSNQTMRTFARAMRKSYV